MEAAAKNERIVVKLIILGCANVGKTSLMKRYCRGTFSEKRVPTIGTDFLSKRIEIRGETVQLQVWDTAGMERFSVGSVGGAFYRGSDGCLIVYDVTDSESFEQVQMWRNELIANLPNDADPSTFPIVVIGNKIDVLHAASAKAAADAADAQAEAEAAFPNMTPEAAASFAEAAVSVNATHAVAEEDVNHGVASGLLQGGKGGKNAAGLQNPDGTPRRRPARKTQADREAVDAWCKDHSIGHLLTSAMDGSGVVVAVEAIAALAVDEQRRRKRASVAYTRPLPPPPPPSSHKTTSTEGRGGQGTSIPFGSCSPSNNSSSHGSSSHSVDLQHMYSAKQKSSSDSLTCSSCGGTSSSKSSSSTKNSRESEWRYSAKK